MRGSYEKDVGGDAGGAGQRCGREIGEEIGEEDAGGRYKRKI